ncbi:hypothetical protein KUTeg_023658 [Tegillarca granosa]|uniref:THAP-type domain-containing protein n=1 Tax=Tegillarca granosa TaxID=220873 RepID=A0ABQ9E2D8_TEGGR|nr:hypothetical protein KUTeg_023658 [Tegillarca granosa]
MEYIQSNMQIYFLSVNRNLKELINIENEAKVGKPQKRKFNVNINMDVSKGHDKHCCVVQCVSNGRQNPNLSFHRFPPPGPKRNMWIWAIRRDLGPLFNISDETVVCSKHFRSEDFKWTPVRKTLKPEAVPSIFNWSKVTEPRRKIIKHEIPQKKCKTEVSLRLETTVNVSKGLDETQQLHLNVGSTSTDEAACANIKDLEDQLKKKNEEVKQLQERLEIERFGVSWFSYDNSKIQFYTVYHSTMW